MLGDSIGINQRRHEVRPPAHGDRHVHFVASLALIIGASRGLGLALAQEYLKRSWSVVGTVRGRVALHDLADRSAGRLEGRNSRCRQA